MRFYFIAVAPTIVSSSKSEMMVSAGGTVTLFCEANSDTPVTFEWSKNGQKLTSNGKKCITHFTSFNVFVDDRVAFPRPGSLQLYGLCIDDAGTYRCTVINQGGAAIYKCNLYVEEGTFMSVIYTLLLLLHSSIVKNP